MRTQSKQWRIILSIFVYFFCTWPGRINSLLWDRITQAHPHNEPNHFIWMPRHISLCRKCCGKLHVSEKTSSLAIDPFKLSFRLSDYCIRSIWFWFKPIICCVVTNDSMKYYIVSSFFAENATLNLSLSVFFPLECLYILFRIS